MRRFRCRLFDRPGSEREVTLEDGDPEFSVPDSYVHEHVKMTVGGVAFVEVAAGDDWELWRCAGVLAVPEGVALYTYRVSLEEARAELARGPS